MAVLPADEYAGRLIITWPKAGESHLFGGRIILADADTGEQIISALDLDLTIHAETMNLITAEMTMLATEDGKLLPNDAKPVLTGEGDNAEIATGRFRWLVTEMRITE